MWQLRNLNEDKEEVLFSVYEKLIVVIGVLKTLTKILKKINFSMACYRSMCKLKKSTKKKFPYTKSHPCGGICSFLKQRIIIVENRRISEVSGSVAFLIYHRSKSKVWNKICGIYAAHSPTNPTIKNLLWTQPVLSHLNDLKTFLEAKKW